MALAPKLLHVFSVLKLPVALAMVGLLALDSYLGLGLGEPVTIMLAAAAGALGVKRPGDLSEKAAKALKESQDGSEG
jgi:hypothetical protein